MGWNSSDIADQSGHTAVVTGANGGLGLMTAKRLAAKGAHVVMAVRNETKARRAVDTILAEFPAALSGTGRTRPVLPGVCQGGRRADPGRP
ncbi:SDR family NAD(P)-dependent oxidoreductase [Streptomyces phaeoluteigriseus]|uniref:SDR family NAD(P)-dependent oxidoreductase n=1 Tax=Streptomyces phaeoluteigriseus TaxID=114686 RepID=UPI0036A89249